MRSRSARAHEGEPIPAATLIWFLMLSAAPADSGAAARSASSAADSSAAIRAESAPGDTLPAPRVVRSFPPVEVRAPLHDMRSSQTVRELSAASLRALPVDALADALALQPGVVAQGEELHVRGGRAGETAVLLDGLGLNEPFRGRPLELPLLAIESAELVTGAPEARYACGVAGALDLHTASPGERLSSEWRWQSDGGRDTRYDRGSLRVSAPVRGTGLGFVVAGEALLDNTSLPMLRSVSRRDVAGMSFGWRAENRLLGYLKLATLEKRPRFSAQLFANRQVHEPYDPAWSLDGWTFVPANPKAPPLFSPDSLPGYARYRAADHLAITDDRQSGALLAFSSGGAERRGSVSLGWLRTRTVLSVGGQREGEDAVHRPRYGDYTTLDQFHALWGDYSLYRDSGSDGYLLRADGEAAIRPDATIKAGAGATYEEVTMREVDWLPLGWTVGGDPSIQPLDSVRTYHAFAPGAFAYVQGRWLSGGMILNLGLRGDWFTAGPQAGDQTLPGDSRGTISLSPRLGIAYPITVRDAFSLAYVRLHQAPARDYLYDDRTAISNRQPLGNPALTPATMISYEAAVKHVFAPEWAMQASIFYRDLYGQVGARDFAEPGGATNLRYTNEDEGQAGGFEWSVIYAKADRRRIEAHYTWLQAWGNESRAEGYPYGTVRAANTTPTADTPLSWDRRHSLLVSGAWTLGARAWFGWSTAVGSPLPWTPAERRAALTDFSTVNSRRLGWTENTNLDLGWAPRRAFGLTFGLQLRNLFDQRGERATGVDGYPNPVINTIYDDYGAYRTETGLAGGAYLVKPLDGSPAYWMPVKDARLMIPPRTVRVSVGAKW